MFLTWALSQSYLNPPPPPPPPIVSSWHLFWRRSSSNTWWRKTSCRQRWRRRLRNCVCVWNSKCSLQGCVSNPGIHQCWECKGSFPKTFSVLTPRLLPCCCCCVFRKHADNNLVDAMETQENDLGPAEGAKVKPTIIFKISSTSNTHVPCSTCVCVCQCQ